MAKTEAITKPKYTVSIKPYPKKEGKFLFGINRHKFEMSESEVEEVVCGLSSIWKSIKKEAQNGATKS